VHGSHRDFGKAWRSVALRVGLPLLGVGMGDGLDDLAGRDDGTMLGLVAGMAAAAVIDWTLLGHQTVPARRRLSGGRTLAATASLTSGGGVAFGLGGSF